MENFIGEPDPSRVVGATAGDVSLASTGQWYAAHVRHQREQSVSGLLDAKAIRTYVPTFQEHRRWSDRMKVLDRPLFPGYVFCCIRPGDWFRVQTTPGVLQIVGTGRHPTPIDSAEMASIQRVVSASVARRPCEYVEVGSVVEVRGGPMDGLTGVLKEVRNERTLVISIGLLRRSIAIDLQDSWITVGKAPQAGIRPPTEVRARV